MLNRSIYEMVDFPVLCLFRGIFWWKIISDNREPTAPSQVQNDKSQFPPPKKGHGWMGINTYTLKSLVGYWLFQHGRITNLVLEKEKNAFSNSMAPGSPPKLAVMARAEVPWHLTRNVNGRMMLGKGLGWHTNDYLPKVFNWYIKLTYNDPLQKALNWHIWHLILTWHLLLGEGILEFPSNDHLHS